MAEPKIELRKTRDLSQNLNDTFAFIRQNFKPLIVSFLSIAGIFMLASSIVSGIYQGGVMGGAFKDIINGNRNISRSPFWMLNGTYFVVIILAWLNVIAMTTAVICYVKVYDKKNGEKPEIIEVWDEFKNYFLKIALYSIPIAFVTVIGYALCLVPGIYLTVVFMPFFVAVIFENETFGQAWNRCFTIIKNNFWSSLGIYFLVYLIYAFSAGIISASLAAIAGVLSYFTTRDISTTIGIATSVLNIFSFVIYIVFYVSVILHYFNLIEIHYGTGMMGRINKLGETGNDINDVQEQY